MGRTSCSRIDQSLQWNTEQALLQGVTAMNAKGGTAVIVDVQTGDILAMASVDGATDTHPAEAAPATENNRPVTDVYEPGSTNKVITMSGAIEEGIVSPDTVFDDVVPVGQRRRHRVHGRRGPLDAR